MSDNKLARKYWKDFENLLFLILFYSFKISENDISQITVPSKDGGYDGFFLINKENYILFEAKLRSNFLKDLPLSDFAKTIIIAINQEANSVIIGTNLHFSKNTNNVLDIFSKKTSLNIQRIDGMIIKKWITENEDKLEQTKISKTLIKSIVGNVKYTEIDTNNYKLDELYTNLSNSKLVVDKNILEIIGEKRKVPFYQYLESIEQNSGIYIIKGESGIGKSIFFQNIIKNLETVYKIKNIDFKEIGNFRILTYKLLEALWNIPHELFVYNDKNFFISLLKEQDLKLEYVNSMSSIFSMDYKSFESKKDIISSDVAKYLALIFKKTPIKKTIFHFENLNYASKEMLDFFISFLSNVNLKNVCFLIELSTLYHLGNNTIKFNWNNYLLKFDKLQYVFSQNISIWNERDVDRYLNENLGFYEVDIFRHIFKRFGSSPIILSSLVKFFRNNNFFEGKNKLMILNDLDSLTFISENEIIPLLINSQRNENAFIDIIFNIMGLVQGRLCNISLFTKQENFNFDFIELALSTQLFEYNPKNDTLYILHDFYLKYMINKNTIYRNDNLKCIKTIYKNIDVYTIIDKKHIHLHCLNFLGEKEILFNTSFKYAKTSFNEGNYSDALTFFEFALKGDAYNELEYIEALIFIYYIKLFMLEIDDINDLETKKIDNLLDNITFKDNIKFKLLKVRWEYTKLRRAHLKRNLEYEKDHIYSLMNFIFLNKIYLEDMYLFELIYESYAYYIKLVESIDKCVEVLKIGLQLFPKSKELLRCYLTHLTYKFRSRSPEIILNIYILITRYYKYYSLGEIIHNDTNIIINLFYLKNYNSSKEMIDQTLNNAYCYNHNIEVCRLLNIKGGLSIIDNNIVLAKKYFENGINLALKDGIFVELIPLCVNIIGLYQAEHNEEKILKYLTICITHIERYSKINSIRKIHDFITNGNYMDDFDCVTFISLYFYILNSQNQILIQKMLKLENINFNFLNDFLKDKSLLEIFVGGRFIHNNYLITKS